jgi:Cu/Ag efflux pump CusA
VLMTAAAMVAGMIPMAIGGPGEEQNAALARAVIGGLLFATPNDPAHRPLSLRHAAQAQRRRRGLWRFRGPSQ